MKNKVLPEFDFPTEDDEIPLFQSLDSDKHRMTEPSAKLDMIDSIVSDKSRSLGYHKREELTKIYSECGRYIYHFSLVDYLHDFGLLQQLQRHWDRFEMVIDKNYRSPSTSNIEKPQIYG
jgi:hypothetical protein